MIDKYRLHLPSGNLFVVDPLYIAGINESMAENANVLSLCESRRVAFYDWALAPGTYNFPLTAIQNPKRHPNEAPDESKLFPVDSATVLVADVQYLSSILTEFRFDDAFTVTGNPSRAYERVVSDTLECYDENAFALVASPGIQNYYEFIGDSVYFLKERTFSQARKRLKKSAQ